MTDADRPPRVGAREAEVVAGEEAGLEDTDVFCVACEVEPVRRLELPGGRIVDVDRVPFTDAVAGVTSIRQCPACEEVIVRER